VSVSSVRDQLARRGLLARRDLGQNFLVDPELARKLVLRSGVAPEDTVLEIGAGLGVLTRALAESAGRVVSLEVDAGLVRALVEEGDLPAHVELRHEDALQADLAAALPPEGPARVVASLPYAISAPLLRRILDLRDRLEGWSVMVQREVAERLEAAPGSRDYGSLAVLHRLTAKVVSGIDLHPRCFYPVPRVTSRFLNIRPRVDATLSPGELARVEPLIRAAFRHRRKTLVNSLRTALGGMGELPRDLLPDLLAGLGKEPGVRAEQLEAEELLELARRLTDATRVEGSPHG
jgi:16S rRNA (adenine1518-N6/adenine1519-N6)-dimethyltransferase